MASATYEIAIDIGRNNTYAHAQSNVTAYVMGDIKWTNGLRKWDDEFGQPQRMTFTLDNSTGIFDPERAAATYYNLILRGMLVRLRATFSATTYTLFIGKIDKLTYDNTRYGRKVVNVSVRDLLPDLLEAEYRPRLLQNVRTDEALEAVFEQSNLALPYASSYWILGSTLYSLLGTTTTLQNLSNLINFDEGITILPYVGDNLGTNKGISAQTALRQIVAAECGGRFFYNTRTGQFVFQNRHSDINPTFASGANLTDDLIEDWEYVSQDDVVNYVTVRYQPRSVGDENAVVWQQEDVTRVSKNSQRVINATYRSPIDELAKIGVVTGQAPVLGTDYIINTLEDGAGSNVTSSVGVTVDFAATKATITLTNDNAYDVFFTLLRLRGTPLYSYDQVAVEVIDPDSIGAYELSAKSVDVSALSDADTAEAYATYLLERNDTPTTRVDRVTLILNKSSTWMTYGLSLTVGDAIDLTATRVGHSAGYIIVGEQHSVRMGGEHTHSLTWILKPANKTRAWVLGTSGFSELGTTTRLIF